MPGRVKPQLSASQPENLREKYRVEREKRLRSDGAQQYRHIDEQGLSHYAQDPYLPPDAKRQPPVDEEVDCLVVGGGFGGLLIATKLVEAGVSNIRIAEKAGDFGGTWYWNRYPGIACDIESYIYMPLLEEMQYMPTKKYASGQEIFEYAQSIGKKYGLYEKALFQTEVRKLQWDESSDRWIVSTSQGDCIRARWVTTAGGVLHKPKFPGVQGIESFKGHSFHTSRWDYEYTGGDTSGGLTKLADKRIAVIGTGATAIQIVPQLAQHAKHLYLFQRTPSSVDVRNNRPTDPTWAGSLKGGWQRERRSNFSTIVAGGREDVDLVEDGWTDILQKLGTAARSATGNAAELVQLADFQKMDQIRARVDEIVHDPEVGERLKPWYNQLCKRPCFHDEYLTAFNRPNVTLVDTNGQGVDRITEDAIVAGGEEYGVDCIIYATGFSVGSDWSFRTNMEVRGKDGVLLADKWKDGASTLHGMSSRGFPNFLIVTGPQSGFLANFTHMIEEQAGHAAYLIGTCRRRGITAMEPTSAAEAEYVDEICKTAQARAAWGANCTPGYYNAEGQQTAVTARNMMYPGGGIAYLKLLDDWRGAGDLAGMEVKSAA